MKRKVTVANLKGLLTAIEMATTALESGCDDPDTISDVENASACYNWVLKEIQKRERRKSLKRG